MTDAFKAEWKTKVESDQGVCPNQRNKLRTYRLFKNEYYTDPLVELLMSSRGHFLLIMIVVYQNVCLDV